MATRHASLVCAALVLATCGSMTLAQFPVLPATSAALPASSHPQAASLAAGSNMYPFYWGVAGSRENEVNFGEAPIQRRAIVFYEQHMGRSPRIWISHDGTMVSFEHGGVPQACDWPAHLTKLREDIARSIPDPNWDGYAVLDYETWEPVWDLLRNELMKEESRRLVRERFPQVSAEEVERRAKEEFEAAAIDFLVRTVEACKQERPNAKWGFYGYPYPHQEPYRASHYQPLWDSVTAMYPSIYVTHFGLPAGAYPSNPSQRLVSSYMNDIRTKVGLARTIMGNRPVMPFIWMRYHEMNNHYRGQWINDLDLAAIVRTPHSAGANGSIFWDVVSSQDRVDGYNAFVPERLTPIMQEFHLELAPPLPPEQSSPGAGSQPAGAPGASAAVTVPVAPAAAPVRKPRRQLVITGTHTRTGEPAPAPTAARATTPNTARASTPSTADLMRRFGLGGAQPQRDSQGRITTVTNAPIPSE